MASKTMAKFAHVLQDAKHITERVNDAPEISIEKPDGTSTRSYAPIATSESSVIASCCRGCKALNRSGGGQFHVLSDAMSRSPVLRFNCTQHATVFARRVPDLWIHKPSCSRWSFTSLVSSLKATSHWTKSHPGELSARLEVLRLSRGPHFPIWYAVPFSSARLRTCTTFSAQHKGWIRNGQFGSNINVAKVITGIFIATGQDAAAVAEGPFGHLTPEYDHESRQVKLTLYFPSLPVGTVGDGTAYETQREALGILGCSGSGMNPRLAGLIAAFTLTLKINTAAATATNTFTQSHERLAYAKQQNDKASKF
ncbi:unnamed protein product [Penicillium nalgiovense]|nr:unnamed protein product [Penicillium nalgiovense]